MLVGERTAPQVDADKILSGVYQAEGREGELLIDGATTI